MPNKVVQHKTKDGFLFDVIVPEGSPAKHTEFGVRVGPPDLSNLGLPKEVERRLNNALYARKLFTVRDVKNRRQDVVSAWQAVLAVDVSRIVETYSEGANATGS